MCLALAFDHRDDSIDTGDGKGLLAASEPLDSQRLNRRRRAEPEARHGLGVGRVARPGTQTASLRLAGGPDRDDRTERIAV